MLYIVYFVNNFQNNNDILKNLKNFDKNDSTLILVNNAVDNNIDVFFTSELEIKVISFSQPINRFEIIKMIIGKLDSGYILFWNGRKISCKDYVGHDITVVYDKNLLDNMKKKNNYYLITPNLGDKVFSINLIKKNKISNSSAFEFLISLLDKTEDINYVPSEFVGNGYEPTDEIETLFDFSFRLKKGSINLTYFNENSELLNLLIVEYVYLYIPKILYRTNPKVNLKMILTMINNLFYKNVKYSGDSINMIKTLYSENIYKSIKNEDFNDSFIRDLLNVKKI